MSGHIQKKLIPRGSGATLVVLASALLMASGLSGAYAQETFTLEVSGQTFDVQYEITGGTVEGMSADPDTQTVAVMVDSTEDGSLTIWLPTDLIFADDEFAVFVDGESGNFVVDELTPTADASVLMIELATGAEVVEIVGTSMLAGGGAVGDTFSLDIAGQTYDIPFEVSGGTVQGMTADPASTTLVVDIDATDDGTLKIWLPTQVIDAEDEFAVAIDGESGNFVVDELDPTADARVLQIEFPNGAQEVEIIGTFLVPEFGVIAAIILAIAIVGVITATSYRKLPSQRAM